MGLRDVISRRGGDVVDLASRRAQLESDGDGEDYAEDGLMPGEYRATSAPYNVRRGINAAAQRVNLGNRQDLQDMADRPWAAWQEEAWQYHDAIGEVNYGHELLASVMSRIRLYPAIVIDPDSPPMSVSQLRRRKDEQNEQETQRDERTGLNMPDEITDEVLDFMETAIADLGSGTGGIAELMRLFTLNMSVPGECYLARIDGRWSIRSTSEIQARGAGMQAILQESRSSRSANGQGWRTLPSNTYVARMWRKHPRWSKEPTSHMLALIEPSDELLTLQRMVRSIARSRMNAGVLFLPDGLTVAGSSVTENREETEDDTDEVIDELYDAMTTPIDDESAESSVVPMTITGSAELGEQIRHILFERTSDRFLVERLDKVLDRILNGLNIPKEPISGLDQVRYANADRVNENMYKMHVEPLAVMFCDNLTLAYLRVRVKAKFPQLSDDALRRLVTWYDPNEVVIHSDPAESADSGYDKHLLSGAAWRRAHGYSDADAPSQREIATRMLIESLGRNLPPNVQDQILRASLPQLFGENTPSDAPLPAQETPPDRRFGPADAITSPPNGSNGTGEESTRRRDSATTE